MDFEEALGLVMFCTVGALAVFAIYNFPYRRPAQTIAGRRNPTVISALVGGALPFNTPAG